MIERPKRIVHVIPLGDAIKLCNSAKRSGAQVTREGFMGAIQHGSFKGATPIEGKRGYYVPQEIVEWVREELATRGKFRPSRAKMPEHLSTLMEHIAGGSADIRIRPH
jgi:hypothetical protein